MISYKLIEEFLNTKEALALTSRLKSNFKESYIYGVTESSKGFLLTSLHYTISRPILYIASDTSSALSLYHEIYNLASSIKHNPDVYYFCGQEISPYDQISSDIEVISNQSKTLYNLLKKKSSSLVITTSKYLLERIWNKEDLLKNCFEISYKAKLNIPEITKKLINLGYERTSLVSCRGEFSIRGNIFDIYPVIGEPTRMELVGDETESIRLFSLTTQRSQDNIEKVIISPRYYVINPPADELVSRINMLAKGDPALKEIAEQETEQIKINKYHESIEYYAHLINQRNSSLFDYLDPKTIVFVNDWEENAFSLDRWYSRNQEVKEELEKNKKIIPLKEFLLLNNEDVLKNLKSFPVTYIERFELQGALEPAESKVLLLNLTPSPRFHNQIDNFIEAVNEWIKNRNKIIIFSEQPQRIKGILREWNLPSIYSEEYKDEDHPKHQIFISKEGPVNGFTIDSANIIVLTDQEIFGTKRRPDLLKKTTKQGKYDYYTNIEDLKPNDFVVHVKHGIGKYRGLVKMTIDNVEREYLMIEYAQDGKLYLPVEQINLLYRYRGSHDVLPKLSKLGGTEWELTKKKVKKAVKRIAEDLLNLYTARSKIEGFAFNKDSHWQIEMEESFPYTETPDQWKAICEVKTDMESSKPTDRLICGDVGFGKTEVALRGIFKAVLSGKQAAILVPTTILAQQHFNVISERFAPYPIKIAMLSRFVSPREQKKILARLSLGEIDVIIGTHRLLQDDVKFKNLGFVVIDEEQRFGVAHKEKLKQLRVNVDVITLSATPIPRTLHMALSGARDMSLINTPPVNRLPVKTYIGEFKPTIIKTAILHELERGGQVYIVHNRVETINKVATYIKETVNEARVAIAHGQMHEKDLENVMFDFLLKKYNVLVCTTIIESGIDIPNVNTIIIDNSHQLGLAQLYQLRGRVGRSDIQAYAYCLYHEDAILTEAAKNRLQAIREFSNLGSGYQIALRDMEIRGVGNILGPEQHGHMISVGFDFYCELLSEAIDKLRGLEVSTPELDCVVDLNINAYIPTSYIEDETQKVIEYKRLANIRTIKELEYINSEWEDRFGNLPVEVENLIKIVRLRILANQIGIKSIKTEGVSPNIKIEFSLRLQKWLNIQEKLPQNLKNRISFKSSARAASEPSYLLLKTSSLTPFELLEILFTLIENLRTLNLGEKIA